MGPDALNTAVPWQVIGYCAYDPRPSSKPRPRSQFFSASAGSGEIKVLEVSPVGCRPSNSTLNAVFTLNPHFDFCAGTED